MVEGAGNHSEFWSMFQRSAQTNGNGLDVMGIRCTIISPRTTPSRTMLNEVKTDGVIKLQNLEREREFCFQVGLAASSSEFRIQGINQSVHMCNIMCIAAKRIRSI